MPAWNRSFKLPGVSAQEAFDRVKKDLAALLEKSQLGGFELTQDPESKKVEFKSKLASASLLCRDGEIAVDAKLSLAAFAFRGKIEQTFEKWVAEWKKT